MISHITHHKSFEFSLAAIYRKGLLLALSSLAAVLLLPGRSTAQQATLTDDAQTSAAAPNQNFGSNVSVRVSGANIQGFSSSSSHRTCRPARRAAISAKLHSSFLSAELPRRALSTSSA
jgi:hypothetical protein